MTHQWTLENEGHLLLNNTVITTSVEGEKLETEHRALETREDALNESTIRREDVVSDIAGQRLIIENADAKIVTLEARLVDVTQAEDTATRRRDESAISYSQQVTATLAKRA